MKYRIKDKEIHIIIPASNKGPSRFKIRDDDFDFGKSFAARSEPLNKRVYLEWQIGYDATVKDLEDNKKYTNLTKLSFTGYNKKLKYPYELSELIYEAVKIGFIPLESLEKLGQEIKNYKEFLGDKDIDVSRKGKLSLNGISFAETVIQLPTFFIRDLKNKTQIEISTQKQQYATGIQPMLYFAIPIDSFSNGKDFYGKISKPGDELIYVIDKNNAENLLLMFKVFAMASPAHNHDIKEIIKVLLSLLSKKVR